MAERVDFATRIDSGLMSALRDVAQSEGKDVEAVIEEALVERVERSRSAQPRQHVMEHYRASIRSFGQLYERLAR